MAVNIALCQMDIIWENIPANLSHLRALLDAEDLPPNTVVILPEMFASGFTMNTDITCSTHEIILNALKDIAQEKHLCFIAGIAGRTGNRAELIGPDGTSLGSYSKIHPFSPSGEGECYPAGDSICSVDYLGLRLSPFVCYDLRFPEIFRQASADGAQLLTVIANWPAKRDDHWRTLLKARAIENQAYVVGVNRVGSDPNVAYCGSSVVFGPTGDALVSPFEGEQIVQIELSADVIHASRSAFPALRDRKDLS